MVSVGIIPQYDISFIVKVMLKRRYAAANIPMNAQPSTGKQNTIMMTAPVSTAPMVCQGLYLPHFDLVFSTIPPIIGSLKASNILAAMMMIVIEAN